MGDEPLALSASLRIFIPRNFPSDGGFHVNKWTRGLGVLRAAGQAPLVSQRVFDAFYSVDTIRGLPSGQNRTSGFTASDLSRFQVNLTHANTLTGSFLLTSPTPRAPASAF